MARKQWASRFPCLVGVGTVGFILSPGFNYVVLNERFRGIWLVLPSRPPVWEFVGLAAARRHQSFDLGASWIASQLGQIVGKDCRVIAGLYASFLFQSGIMLRNDWGIHPARMILKNYGKHSPSARVVCGMDQS